MNPITLTLLVVIAVFGAIASLVLALAIARAQEGHEDEAGFHRGGLPFCIRLTLTRVRVLRTRSPGRRKRAPHAERVSAG